MSWKQHFRRLLWLLHYVGILPATYCDERQELVSRSADVRRSTWTTALLALVVAGFFIHTICLARERNFNIYGPGKAGNTLIVFQLLACAAVQLTLSGCLAARRQQHVRMLNVIWRHASSTLGASVSAEGQRLSRSVRNLCVMTVLLFAIFEWNVLISCLGEAVPLGAAVCAFVILSVHYASASLVMASYSCTILIVRQLIVSYNGALFALCSAKCGTRSAALDIRHLLRMRVELISLCATHVNRIYGLAVLLESCYVLCTVPAFPFLIGIIFEWGVPDAAAISDLLYKTFLWVSSFVIFMYPLIINNIAAEANKTVHIVSLVPRSNYGVKKTVDKFLLKNLRQRPIVTAYGFYALDTGTLFQLLTAILPFMVILMQFKQTEFSARV